MNLSRGNCHKQYFLSRVDRLRKQLIATGLKEGLSSPKTLEVSQELDQLLNMLLHRK